MMNHYALIDGDIPTGIFAMLKAFDPPASCLYNMPVRADLVDTAPYLVELTDPVKTWLDQHPAPWGIYIASKVPLIELRKHLRKYTYAIIPLSEAPLLFRFYDPRIIWDITSILDDHALHAFMGPIEVIATNYKGLYKQENFTARRAQFSKPHRMKGNYLTLNAEQYAAFNRFSEDAYIQELSDHMWSCIDPAVYDNPQKSANQIHREMLRHDQDIKGGAITHSLDMRLLNEAPYFIRSDIPHIWMRIEGEETIILDRVISQVLTNLNKPSITEAQFIEMTKADYAHYLKRFIQDFRQMHPQEKVAEPLSKAELRIQIEQFSRDFVQFGMAQGITDDRSFKSLGELFIYRDILQFDDIPNEWVSDLTPREDNKTPIIRAMELFVKIVDDEKTIISSYVKGEINDK